MSVFAIPDIHASLSWKEVFGKRKEGDTVVFLGDYFDERGCGPFADNQVLNFLDIADYVRNTPDAIMLLGNHEFDYLPWTKAVIDEKPLYTQAIMDNLDILQIVHIIRPAYGKPVLFSHGGVTNSFMRLHNFARPEQINSLWKNSPESLDWQEFSPLTGERSQWTGDDVWQSPLWARTFALENDGLRGFDQVVGHTPVDAPKHISTRHGDQVFLTCSFNDSVIGIDLR